MQYMLINQKTNVIENIIELEDQSDLPPIPTDEEAPEAPIPPRLPIVPIPTLPQPPEEVDNPFLQEEYQKEMAIYEQHLETYNDEQVAYSEAFAIFIAALQEYHPAVAEYNASVRAAYKVRYTPPEGFLLVQGEGKIGSSYINGEVIDPPAPEEPPAPPAPTLEDLLALQSELSAKIEAFKKGAK